MKSQILVAIDVEVGPDATPDRVGRTTEANVRSFVGNDCIYLGVVRWYRETTTPGARDRAPIEVEAHAERGTP